MVFFVFNQPTFAVLVVVHVQIGNPKVGRPKISRGGLVRLLVLLMRLLSGLVGVGHLPNLQLGVQRTPTLEMEK